jgi:hypothetical protein
MRRLIIIGVAISFALTACGGGAENLAEQAIEAQTGEGVQITEDDGTILIESEDDGGTLTIEEEEGEGITITGTDESGEQVAIQMGGTEVPDDFPMPLFDPSEVTHVASMDTPDGSSTSVTLEIDPGDAAAAIDFYRDWLGTQDMEVTSSDTMVIGESDTVVSIVQVTEYGAYSEVVVSWSPTS